MLPSNKQESRVKTPIIQSLGGAAIALYCCNLRCNKHQIISAVSCKTLLRFVATNRRSTLIYTGTCTRTQYSDTHPYIWAVRSLCTWDWSSRAIDGQSDVDESKRYNLFLPLDIAIALHSLLIPLIRLNRLYSRRWAEILLNCLGDAQRTGLYSRTGDRALLLWILLLRSFIIKNKTSICLLFCVVINIKNIQNNCRIYLFKTIVYLFLFISVDRGKAVLMMCCHLLMGVDDCWNLHNLFKYRNN